MSRLRSASRVSSPPPVVLRLPDAARYLTLSPRTVKGLVASGALPAVQLSPRRIAFRITDLDTYIESRRR